jgi:DNA repair protein RAD5
MRSKELGDEESARKNEALHPLWHEYAWPNKNENDEPSQAAQSYFYLNPFSSMYWCYDI